MVFVNTLACRMRMDACLVVMQQTVRLEAVRSALRGRKPGSTAMHEP